MDYLTKRWDWEPTMDPMVRYSPEADAYSMILSWIVQAEITVEIIPGIKFDSDMQYPLAQVAAVDPKTDFLGMLWAKDKHDVDAIKGIEVMITPK